MGADFSFPKGLEHLIHEKEQDRSKSRTDAWRSDVVNCTGCIAI